MSSIKMRVSQLADEVKAAGLAGRSMQEALEKVAVREDLGAEEIGRVAEIANREVQLALHKTAADKRFKFDVADAKVAVAKIRKHAGAVAVGAGPGYGMNRGGDTFDKVASEIDAAGGDPFAAPYREPKAFSLYDHAISEEQADKLAASNADVEDRTTLFELDKARLELEILDRQNNHEMAKVAATATEYEKQAVQSTIELIEAGLTLPDLYDAMVATCTEESTKPEEAQAKADQLFGLVISGLKARGVTVSKMGFRDYHDPAALEALDTDALLEWAKEQSGYTPCNADTISLCDTKTASAAEYSEAYVGDGKDFTSAHLHDKPGSPEDILSSRDSLKDPKNHASRLSNAANKTLPVRVVNGNNSLVIAVRGLVGDQRRMTRLHAAKEYMGLKLKEIADAMNQLAGVREARK